MRTHLYLVSGLLILLSGCSPEDNSEGGAPFFKFSAADKAKLINPQKMGTVIKYKNQSNVIHQFTVNQCSQERDSYGFSSFWGSSYSIDYYYDTQKTRVSYSGNDGYISYDIHFQTTPSHTDYSSYPYKFSNPVFAGYINFSLFNNDCTENYYTSCGSIQTTNYSSNATMVIEGKTYEHVKQYVSGSNTVIDYTDPMALDRTVNRIYYSDEYGIIGYDEIDGTTWRRVE
jgi:hypothetical protein